MFIITVKIFKLMHVFSTVYMQGHTLLFNACVTEVCSVLKITVLLSLVPRPYEGEERAWYTLLAHAPGTPEKCGAPDTIVYLVYDAYSVYTLR